MLCVNTEMGWWDSQWVANAKLGDLSMIPSTHIVEGEHRLL